jgi:hypothetical protein
VGHVSATVSLVFRSRFGAFVSAGKIPFPGNRVEETRFDCVIIEQEYRGGVGNAALAGCRHVPADRSGEVVSVCISNRIARAIPSRRGSRKPAS